MYKVPCNNPFILFSPDSWSKPAQLFKSQLLATAYTSPWGYASVILLWSCMSNGINSHKKCVRRQPKVSNPAAVLNFWNSELSSFSIALLKFSLMLQSIQSWSLGTFAFLYIFFHLCSLLAFSHVLFVAEGFFSSFKFQDYFIHSGISMGGEFTFFLFFWECTQVETQITLACEDSQAIYKEIRAKAVCVCVCLSIVWERGEKK